MKSRGDKHFAKESCSIAFDGRRPVTLQRTVIGFFPFSVFSSSFFRFQFRLGKGIKHERLCSTTFPNTSVEIRQKYSATSPISNSVAANIIFLTKLSTL